MPQRSRAELMRSDTAFRALPSARLVAQAELLRSKPAALQTVTPRRLGWFFLGVLACFTLLASAGTRAKPSQPQGALACDVKSEPPPPASVRAETAIVVEPVPANAPTNSAVARNLPSSPSQPAVKAPERSAHAALAAASTTHSAFDEPLAPPE
jgi:hypothetical protein